ncbi:MAG: alpha/beta hydrolase [Limisphaerales bacterium]
MQIPHRVLLSSNRNRVWVAAAGPAVVALSLLIACATSMAAEPACEPVPLWAGLAPGDQALPGGERDLTKATDGLIAGQPVIRLGNVSRPTMTIYRPPADRDVGTTVLVCPGGGYHILAMDLEGTEICEWLNSVGVTAVLLKYRVPKREGLEKHGVALQDAQRAMSLLRHRAREWKLDPERIGALGFSAGSHLAAVLSTGPAERIYPKVDEADQGDFRPNFTVLIYPAYLTVKEDGDKVSPELKITTNTPPTFITITQDDPVRVENALFYALALKQAAVPVELHLYPTGGHGYGLRRTEQTVTTWPDRASDWMRSRGWLQKK